MPSKTIFDRKNVLVIGGAGFIGSHLCDELVRDSKVICVDNFFSGDERNIDHLLSDPNFLFIRHDITTPLDLEVMVGSDKFKVKFQGIQEIYQLACPTSPKKFKAERMEIIAANSSGMKNALELALKYRAKFLQFSSSVVYGPRRADNPKIGEDDNGAVDPVSPRSAYDEGKRFAEAMVAAYREVHKIDAKIARVFRTYGPRMKLGEGHMIPDFVESALEGKDLVVHGDESFSSSFCYVSDIVDGAIKLMESGEAGPVNLGSDMEIKISDIASRIISAIGSKSKISYGENLLFMTPLCLPDIGKARERLNWIPVVTLDQGLKETIDQLRVNRGLLGIGRLKEE